MKKNSKKPKTKHKLKKLFWAVFMAGCLWVAFVPPVGKMEMRPLTEKTVDSAIKRHSEKEHEAYPQYTLAPFELPGMPLPYTAGGEESVPQAPSVHEGEKLPPIMPSTPPAYDKSRKVKIAIVIDDIGPDYKGSEKAISLPPSITLALLPYSSRVRDQARDARAKGHEILLHMPMEPMGHENPGSNALLVDLPIRDLQQRFEESLASFTGYDGVNNHMGSKFTAWPEGMEMVMDQLQQRGLFFLDSRTTSKTIALNIAAQKGVPAIGRDVFLDDTPTIDSIRRQFAIAEHIAFRKGYAVAIGHPHATTLKVLSEWLIRAENLGIEVVPVSQLLSAQPE